MYPLAFMFLCLSILSIPVQGAEAADLKGVWQSSEGQMHIRSKGFLPEPFKHVLIIKEQQGRIIVGEKNWGQRIDFQSKLSPFSAILGYNDRYIYFARDGQGIVQGELVDNDTMFFYYIKNDADPKTLVLKLKRSK